MLTEQEKRRIEQVESTLAQMTGVLTCIQASTTQTPKPVLDAIGAVAVLAKAAQAEITEILDRHQDTPVGGAR